MNALRLNMYRKTWFTRDLLHSSSAIFRRMHLSIYIQQGNKNSLVLHNEVMNNINSSYNFQLCITYPIAIHIIYEKNDITVFEINVYIEVIIFYLMYYMKLQSLHILNLLILIFSYNTLLCSLHKIFFLNLYYSSLSMPVFIQPVYFNIAFHSILIQNHYIILSLFIFNFNFLSLETILIMLCPKKAYVQISLLK